MVRPREPHDFKGDLPRPIWRSYLHFQGKK
jgi:hypothetical protein